MGFSISASDIIDRTKPFSFEFTITLLIETLNFSNFYHREKKDMKQYYT